MGVCSVSMPPPKGRLHFYLRRRTKKKFIWLQQNITGRIFLALRWAYCVPSQLARHTLQGLNLIRLSAVVPDPRQMRCRVYLSFSLIKMLKSQTWQIFSTPCRTPHAGHRIQNLSSIATAVDGFLSRPPIVWAADLLAASSLHWHMITGRPTA